MSRETPSPERTEAETNAPSRRDVLGSVGAVAATGLAGALAPSITGMGGESARATPPPPSSGTQRARRSYDVRVAAARENLLLPTPPHPSNGDEELTARTASFTKGLPHNAFGEVNLAAYDAYLDALSSGSLAAFEAIPHGCPDIGLRMKLVNPQAGLAFDLEGTDSHQFAIPPAPMFHSAWEAGEIVENYWMALLRDVPFTEYDTHPLVQAACADLSAMSDFRGPKLGGQVRPKSLFREVLPGWNKGPYISQFFWKSQPFGAQYVEPRIRTPLPGSDFMTTPAKWLSCQNGVRPLETIHFDPLRRYIRNGRDLGQWVHIDVLFQAYFQAALTMMAPQDPTDPITGGGIGAPLNPSNPYLPMLKQEGFGTFGGPYIATILCEVATRALKAVWFQKWFVHRRLRPEEFGGRIHHKLVNGRSYSVHADALASQSLAEVFNRNGTYFLPMAFPEGCPIHPAYGAGHATVAGACVTILKALFCETYVIPDPVVPTTDGLALIPYTGSDASDMTVMGELNKLASNVAYGRNMAGVHWRTDATESLRLGEAVAMSVLRDQRRTYNEPFDGFTFTRFDGTQVTV